MMFLWWTMVVFVALIVLAIYLSITFLISEAVVRKGVSGIIGGCIAITVIIIASSIAGFKIYGKNIDTINASIKSLEASMATVSEEIAATEQNLNQVNVSLDELKSKKVQKEFKAQKKVEIKELKMQKKAFKKELGVKKRELRIMTRQVFFKKHDRGIFLFIEGLIVIILLCMVCRVLYLKMEIKKAASYIDANLEAPEQINEAQNFISSYRRKLIEFKISINDAEDSYHRENSQGWFLNFGHTKRLENAKSRIMDMKDKKHEYEMANEGMAKSYENFLSSLNPSIIETYNKYEDAVRTAIQALKIRTMKKQETEKQQHQEQQVRARQLAIENIAKESKARADALAVEQKKEKVGKSINELENFVPVLQNHVSTEKKMDFQLLATIEKMLDAMEDLREFIAEEDMNNIERCKKKLMPLFERCENKEEIQSDFEIITESFSKILNA